MRDRRDRLKLRVRPAVARQHGQRLPLGCGQSTYLSQPVFPIWNPADHADQYGIGARKGLLDISVNRNRMPECGQVGESQARQRRALLPCAMPPGREGLKIAVRERQSHEIGWRLLKVGRGLGFLEPEALAKDHMHVPNLSADALRLRTVCRCGERCMRRVSILGDRPQFCALRVTARILPAPGSIGSLRGRCLRAPQ